MTNRNLDAMSGTTCTRAAVARAATTLRALCMGAVFTLLGCSTDDPAGMTPRNFEGPPPPPALAAFRIDGSAYCRTVGQPGLAHWDRDLLTTCPDAIALDEGAPCTVSELVGGTARAVDIPDVRVALRALAGIVVLKTTGALVLRSPSGDESEIAAWASEPSVAADGVRVVFVTVAEGTDLPTEPFAEPGTPLRIVLHDLRDGAVRTITRDPDASAPYAVPGSDAVVYVSSRSGMASIWRSNGQHESQITNLGLDSGDQGILPTFDSNIVWVPATGTMVFQVDDAESSVWQYNVARSVVEPLGPGAWPQLASDGALLATNGLSSDPACAVRYLSGGEP